MTRRTTPQPNQPSEDEAADDEQENELVPLGHLLAGVDAAFASETHLGKRVERFVELVGERATCPACGAKTYRVRRAGRSRSDLLVDNHPEPLTPHGFNCRRRRP